MYPPLKQFRAKFLLLNTRPRGAERPGASLHSTLSISSGLMFSPLSPILVIREWDLRLLCSSSRLQLREEIWWEIQERTDRRTPTLLSLSLSTLSHSTTPSSHDNSLCPTIYCPNNCRQSVFSIYGIRERELGITLIAPPTDWVISMDQ